MRKTTATLWPARRSRGGDAALWASVGLGVLAAAALGSLPGLQPGGAMLAAVVGGVLLAAGAGVLLVWAIGYRRLTYVLGEDRLEIPWLGETLAVPYTAIDGIYAGRHRAEPLIPGALCWPGIYVGPGRTPGMGSLRFFATSRDPAHLTLVTVEDTSLVLSARDPLGFRAALIQRVQQHENDPAPDQRIARIPLSGAPWTTLRDRLAPWCLGLAGALLLVTLALIMVRYQGLPDRLPMRFDASGRPSEIGFKADLFHLPLGGLLTMVPTGLLGIWLHPREPLLARVLWVASVLVQAVLFVAILRFVQ
jgi:hypothetical protein